MNKPIGWDLSVKYATSQAVCSSLVMSETIWLYLEFIFDGKSTSVAYTFIKHSVSLKMEICVPYLFSDHHSSSVGVPLNWMTKTKIQIGQQISQTPSTGL